MLHKTEPRRSSRYEQDTAFGNELDESGTTTFYKASVSIPSGPFSGCFAHVHGGPEGEKICRICR